jgi:hypothetical protein
MTTSASCPVTISPCHVPHVSPAKSDIGPLRAEKVPRDEIFLTKSVDARGRSLNNSASRFTALVPQHPGSEVKHFSAPVAQLDRVPGYELGGREFESLRAHHFICEAGCLHPVLFSRRRALLLP